MTDKEILKQRLEMYLAAERAILNSQAYTIGDRVLQRPDLKYVQEQISALMAELNAAGRAGSKRVVFI